MNYWYIFAVGVFVTLVLGGGLIFTVVEMRRISGAAVERAPRGTKVL